MAPKPTANDPLIGNKEQPTPNGAGINKQMPQQSSNWFNHMLENRNENTQSTFNSIGIQVKNQMNKFKPFLPDFAGNSSQQGYMPNSIGMHNSQLNNNSLLQGMQQSSATKRYVRFCEEPKRHDSGQQVANQPSQ